MLDLLSEHLSAVEATVGKLEDVYVERYEEEVILVVSIQKMIWFICFKLYGQILNCELEVTR